jgi:hypothetical protein
VADAEPNYELVRERLRRARTRKNLSLREATTGVLSQRVQALHGLEWRAKTLCLT